MNNLFLGKTYEDWRNLLLIIIAIFTLYKIIRSLLFSARMNVDLKYDLVSHKSGNNLYFMEIIIKNVGKSSILLRSCQLEILGVNIENAKIVSVSIHSNVSLLSSGGFLSFWYIAQNEIDYRSKCFIIPDGYDLLLVNVIVKYLLSKETQREFHIACKNKGKIISKK